LQTRWNNREHYIKIRSLSQRSRSRSGSRLIRRGQAKEKKIVA